MLDVIFILVCFGVICLFNWWFFIFVMVLIVVVVVWLMFYIFLSEINVGMMVGILVFNIYDEILVSVLGLVDWCLEIVLLIGIVDVIVGLGFIVMD